jgi:hypothetical protein
VTADGVEVTGYPDLARQYQVSSVPKTVVEEGQGAPSAKRLEFVGAGPEAMLLKHVQEAAGASGLVA